MTTRSTTARPAGRRTTCPAGRPMYRIGEVPDGLATMTQLTEMRRRLADGQQPVGTLFYHGNKHTELYAVDAAVELPPPPGRRGERFAQARTCARCAATHHQPWALRDGRRICDACLELESRQAAAPSWVAARAEAVEWAQEVLADPTAVLVVCSNAEGIRFGSPFGAAAVAASTGEVLLDATVWPERPAPQLTRQPGWVTAADIADQILRLAPRRIISSTYGGPAWLVDELRRYREIATRLTHDTSPAVRRRSDLVDARHSAWLARPVAHGAQRARGDRYVRLYARYHSDLVNPETVLVGSAMEQAQAMRDLLTRMAADDHPDGPPACPVLPPTGTQPCGGVQLGPDGRCVVHGLNTAPDDVAGGPE